MKKLTSVLIIISLIFFGINGAMFGANNDQLRVLNGVNKNIEQFVPDEIIVKFKDDSKPFRVIKVPKGQVKEKVSEYSKKINVVYAEPNYYAHAFVNDPFFTYQWNFLDESEGGINTVEAWNTSTGIDSSGNRVIVAVVDTGVAYENYSKYVKAPDLSSTAFVEGYDFVNNDSHPNDDNSHGTHVAGTIAQSTNNSEGVSGIAYDARIMPVKVLNKRGTGTHNTIALGIRFAADNDAQVINLSLGGSSSSSTLRSAVEYAYNKGVTIVAAAGNDGQGTVSYPAAYDQYVIAVGATRYDKTRAAYSNYGSSLDVVAPGGDLSVDQNEDGYADGIVQNTFNPNTRNTSDFSYWFFQGTSMASPHVAGVAALLIANGNAVTPEQVQIALQDTAIDLGSDGRDDVHGYGLINAPAALAWTDVPNGAPTAINMSVSTKEDAPIGIVLTGTDPDLDQLTYTIVGSPTNGVLTGTAPEVNYSPNENYFGDDSFMFIVNDGRSDSNIATVDITIEGVNDQPVATDQSFSTLKNTPLSITLDGTDIESETLLYTVLVEPEYGEVIVDGNNAIYTPNGDFVGEDSFEFSVEDGGGLKDSAVVSILVYEEQTINVSTEVEIITRATKKKTFAWAEAVVTVGEVGTPVSGAVVTGHWEGSATDVDLGTTVANGEVILISNTVKVSSTMIFKFVVDSIEIDGIVYVPVGNLSDSKQL